MTASATWPVDHELDGYRGQLLPNRILFVAVVASSVSDGCRTDFAGVTVHDVRFVFDKSENGSQPASTCDHSGWKVV